MHIEDGYHEDMITAPVWDRSTLANMLDPELNDAYRSSTGCLNLTHMEEFASGYSSHRYQESMFKSGKDQTVKPTDSYKTRLKRKCS